MMLGSSFLHAKTGLKRRQEAFSFLEALVAMAVVGVVFVAFYSGITYGFARVQFSRENLRATQILMEKMETIRLYNWDQLTGTNYFIPTNFVARYDPTDNSGGGVTYSGTLLIEDPGYTVNYSNSIRLVTVRLDWQTGHTPRSRSLTTLVAEGGLYNYIYAQHYH